MQRSAAGWSAAASLKSLRPAKKPAYMRDAIQEDEIVQKNPSDGKKRNLSAAARKAAGVSPVHEVTAGLPPKQRTAVRERQQTVPAARCIPTGKKQMDRGSGKDV